LGEGQRHTTPPLRELLLHAVVCLKNGSEYYKIADEAALALARLMLPKAVMRYLTYLEHKIKTNTEKLFRDERAMRILGKGSALQGKAWVVNDTPQAKLFVCVYSLIEELSETTAPSCPFPERSRQLDHLSDQLDRFLNGERLSSDDHADGKVFLTRDICAYTRLGDAGDSPDRGDLFYSIQQEAKALYGSDMLQISCFKLTGWNQLVDFYNRFDLMWNRGKSPLPERL